MGNQKSQPLLQYVKLQVKVDKQFYHAGEEVSGKIIMTVEKAVTYDQLKITLQGHSYKNWGANSSRMQLFGGKNQKEEFENETIVTEFNNTIQPGRYVFLFSLTLRQDLPRVYSNNNSEEFSNSFPLKASLIGPKQKFNDAQSTYYVIITEPIQFKKKKYDLDFKSNIKVCKCLGSGQTQLKIKFPKNNVKTGEQFEIQFEVNNQECQYDIEKIQVKLYQYSYKVGDGGQFRFYRAIKFQEQTRKIIAGNQQHTGVMISIPSDLRYSTYFGIQKGYYYMVGVKIVYANMFVSNINEEQLCQHIFVQSQKNELYSSRKLSHVLIQSNKNLFNADRQKKYVQAPSK